MVAGCQTRRQLQLLCLRQGHGSRSDPPALASDEAPRRPGSSPSIIGEPDIPSEKVRHNRPLGHSVPCGRDEPGLEATPLPQSPPNPGHMGSSPSCCAGGVAPSEARGWACTEASAAQAVSASPSG